MGYRSLKACVDDLHRNGHLVRLEDPVDAELEAAEIHRRVYRNAGPAVFFQSVKDCRFPMVSNLFGTLDRARFMFRDTLQAVRRLIELKTDPQRFWQQPMGYLRAMPAALHMRPRRTRRGAVLKHAIQIDQLPQLKSWPDDGGAFITLPQVYSEDPDRPGISHSNLGMYRVQISGGSYERNREVGLHYQIHRGIGVHHTTALRRGASLAVNVFVGGTPAMTLSAVMPLPEGMSELTFAGALAGHRIPMAAAPGRLPLYADADFCLVGTVDPSVKKSEGPFGDHLGYYSLQHDYPVLRVQQVFHRSDAIWPFTVVGRPPQEDTVFGQLIHELTGPVIPTVLPGVRAVHAVDAAGVHPLMLAIGSERYAPYQQRSGPQELLTQANAILGQGQMSLAKYLLIVDQQDDPQLDIEDVRAFLAHVLSRADWRRDMHFQTRTTIDTLDYSGSGLNQGSKLVIAAAGAAHRKLLQQMPSPLTLPEGFLEPQVCLPGVLAVVGPSCHRQTDDALHRFCRQLDRSHAVNHFAWIVLCDDSRFVGESLHNFLWTVFTRSNPAVDIDGIDAFVDHKHWGCHGALVIDARIKPHHAPPLVEDPQVSKRVDALAARGGPLARYL